MEQLKIVLIWEYEGGGIMFNKIVVSTFPTRHKSSNIHVIFHKAASRCRDPAAAFDVAHPGVLP